ncbi:MAG: YjjG family noncanonical pyrimidine nucleotidase [Bacteroidales bacterium]|jgi:putative hydrolase of the HAD superfamily|nr:YjjG family noncanonical pyrimidine nucleotidase [Bacteroidales bacterium]HPH52786.1 YjjG family noncanonical pyrimidine nucleotidase [Bacteroidales bacterium]
MIIERYDYFLLDLDRTIWDFDANANAAMEMLLDKWNPPIGDRNIFLERYEVINRRLWDDYEAGRIAKEYLRRERFHQTLRDHYGIDDADAAEQMGSDYLDFMALGDILMPGAREVLEAIAARDGKMAIVSNGFKEVQYRKLRVSKIDHFFRAVMISEEVGVHKPDPLIFQKALEALCGEGVEIDEKIKARTIMIGDDYPNDIVGAIEFGIASFYYNPFNKENPGNAVWHSRDLLSLLSD